MRFCYPGRMLTLSLYILLQCLAGVLGWALIATGGLNGRALLEAGLANLAPLLVASAGGASADMLARLAAAGMAFGLVNWGLQSLRK